MLGHPSASMTLDVYAGLFGDDLDAVAHRLDEAVAARGADYLRTGTDDRTVVNLGKGKAQVCDLGFRLHLCVSEGGLEPPRPCGH